MLLGDEVGLAGDGSEHASPGTAVGVSGRPGRQKTGSAGPSILRAMQEPQETRPRARSPFAAAFLSLLFPGLGQAYAGASMRALGFAAAPILLIALVAGSCCSAWTGSELVGLALNPAVLTSVFIVNILALVYRLIAIIDAYRVAEYLNAHAAGGDGRLGPARLPRNTLTIAGLLAVILVMAGSHVVVARVRPARPGPADERLRLHRRRTSDASARRRTPPPRRSRPDADAPAASAPVTPSPTAEPTPIGSPSRTSRSRRGTARSGSTSCSSAPTRRAAATAPTR